MSIITFTPLAAINTDSDISYKSIATLSSVDATLLDTLNKLSLGLWADDIAALGFAVLPNQPVESDGFQYTIAVTPGNPQQAIFTFFELRNNLTEITLTLQKAMFVSASKPSKAFSVTFPIPSTSVVSVDTTTVTPGSTVPPAIEILAAFLAEERKAELEPCELFQFSWSNGAVEKRECFTSGNDTYQVGVDQYRPRTIKRGETEMTMEINRSMMTITVDKNNEVAQMFISGAPSFQILIKVFRVNVAAVNAPQVCIFQGRIVTCSFSGVEATINCEPIYSHVQKAGLKRMYEPMCSHSLYDINTCGVVKAGDEIFPVGFTIEPGKKVITISNSDFLQKSVDVPATASSSNKAGYYTGGMVQILPEGAFYWITEHTQGKIGLARAIPTRTVEAPVTSIKLFRGCDHTLTTCASFGEGATGGNAVNFGGFPYMVSANPFAGSHVSTGG